MAILRLLCTSIVAAMLASFPVHAEESDLKIIPFIPLSNPPDYGPKFGFVVGGAFEFGGGKVATVAFDDGDTQNIRAGQGLSGFGGLYFSPSKLSPWSARFTAGYKYVTTKASNADIGLGRVPLELIGSYHFYRGFRVGTGVVYHTAIKLDGDGFFDDVKFHDAVGPKVEVGWRFVLLSYTNLRYRASNFEGHSDASNVGITFLWEFKL